MFFARVHGHMNMTRHLRYFGALSIALTCIATNAQAESAFVSSDVAAQAEAPAPQAPFTLVAVTIDGSSIYRADDLSAAYSSYLLQTVYDTDLARIAGAITDHYRRDGYFLSRAVVTGASAGVAQIEVVEGRISEITVRGDGARIVRRILRGFDTQGPAQLRDLDRRMALASDVPGLIIESHIEPDVDNPALHHLIIDTRLQHTTGRAALDNRGAENEGPLRFYAQGAANSALSSGDQLSLAVFGAPPHGNEYRGAELGYTRDLGDGVRLGASLMNARARDGADEATLAIGGERQRAALHLEIPLIRARDRALWATTQFEANEIAYDWVGGGGYIDNTRVLRAGLRGFLNDDGESTTLIVEGALGLDVLGASGGSAMRRSRYDADAQFFSLAFHVAHYRDLGAHFGIYAAVDGQWADDPLLLSEQFQLGGAAYGRAFPYGELTGDKGLAGSVELRAGFDPGLDSVSFIQGYAFVDAGRVWNISPDEATQSLASTGLGMRFTILDRINAGIEFAHPLDLSISDDTEKDWRPSLSLAARY